MAVRCAACGRLTRDEAVCEWCGAEIAPAPRAAGASRGVTLGGGSKARPGATEAAPREAAPAGGSAGAGEAVADSAAQAEGAGSTDTEELAPAGPWYRDNLTLAILLLILLQFVLTLWLGRLSSWWSVTGFLWLLVGCGVVARQAWSLALPLVLFTLDVALLLFGIGPRERAGFFSLAPLDFLLYVLRLAIWGMIWSLREEMD